MTRHWKTTERRLAKFFNTRRTPLSGGNSGHTRADTLSPHIFLESKSSKKSAIWTLFKKTRPLAKAEGKPCVLIHHLDSHEGFLITFHNNDLQAVIEAFQKTGVYNNPNAGATHNGLEGVQGLSSTSDTLPDSSVPG